MTWGTYKWGEGTNSLVREDEKLLTNGIALSALYEIDPEKVISNSISASFECGPEYLADRNGYLYVFRRPTTNADDQVITNWVVAGATAPTWTSALVVTTTWGSA